MSPPSPWGPQCCCWSGCACHDTTSRLTASAPLHLAPQAAVADSVYCIALLCWAYNNGEGVLTRQTIFTAIHFDAARLHWTFKPLTFSLPVVISATFAKAHPGTTVITTCVVVGHQCTKHVGFSTLTWVSRLYAVDPPAWRRRRT